MKNIKYKARNVVSKTKRYAIIASVLLNCIAAGGVIGRPFYLADTGLTHAAQLPGAGLHLQQVAYLSQAIPVSQLHEMPIEEVVHRSLPLPAHKPVMK